MSLGLPCAPEGENTLRSEPWPSINPDRSTPAAARWRETFHVVPGMPAAHIRFRRSEAPPPFAYAITLELVEHDGWHTVRLWDNADELDEHHEHTYVRNGEKQSPVILEFASTNEAMASAIASAKRNAAAIVRQWRAS